MKTPFIRLGAASLLALALAACGGGGGSSAPPPAAATLKDKIAAAAADAANDASTNSSASFAVLQDNGVAVVDATPTNARVKVNFTAFSNGAVIQDIRLNTSAPNNVRVTFAKLVPGANGEIDRWFNYVNRNRVSTSSSKGPNGEPAVLASAIQSTTDPFHTDATALAGQLVYNADGYYTYTFNVDVRNPAWSGAVGSTTYTTNGVVFEPGKTHRIAMQLSYKNAAGETVRVNPYFDVTFDSSGKSVAVTDPAKTRKMTDVSSCNGCHEKLALHGGGRVDTQYCVMCHNPTTVDNISGNNLSLSTMVHSIHSGRRLHNAGVNYYIANVAYSEVGFPQDLRNCTKCHSGSNPKTPQGDNWKTAASKEACLGCHTSKVGGAWEVTHKTYASALTPPKTNALDITNPECAACHKVGSNIASERVHWNQNEENSAKYKLVIESATFNDTVDHKGRTVSVTYYLADPTNGNAKYNLVTSDCTGSGATLSCGGTTKFGNLRFYLAYQNLVGQSTAVTEFTAYNNGGNGANQYLYKGTNDGSNKYTVTIPVPDDTATAVAAGTARVVSIGQIKEAALQVKWATDPRPEVTPAAQVNTVVQHTYKDVAISGTLNPRRDIVSNDKCNVCHGALGTTSGSNTLANAFHSGARNTVEACVVCHDPNRASSGNMMTSGLALYEPYQFKRMIHGIHGNSKRTYPFNHGNPVQGAFSKAGVLTTAGSFFANSTATITGVANTVVITAGTPVPVGSSFGDIETMINTARANAGTYTGSAASIENYAAEVAWPGVGINCNACHVNNSYKLDRGPVGTLVMKPFAVGSTTTLEADPKLWKVITPKASTCTSCHDSSAAIAHVTSFGGAAYGSATQAQSWTTVETCNDCHSSGGFKGVDIVHGQK